MRLAMMSLRTRIYLGFSILVAIGLGMAVFGYHGLLTVGGDVGSMGIRARNLDKITEITRMMEVFRRANTRYLLDASESARSEALRAQTRLTALLAGVTASTISAQRRAAYDVITTKLRGMIDQNAEFQNSIQAGYQERERLFAAGDALSAAT